MFLFSVLTSVKAVVHWGVLNLRSGEEVLLLFVFLKHLTFPGWEGDLIIKISIAVSNGQVVWINIMLSSNNNWAFLIELIFLS